MASPPPPRLIVFPYFLRQDQLQTHLVGNIVRCGQRPREPVQAAQGGVVKEPTYRINQNTVASRGRYSATTAVTLITGAYRRSYCCLPSTTVTLITPEFGVTSPSVPPPPLTLRPPQFFTV
eukprot:gene13714-biopygen3535